MKNSTDWIDWIDAESGDIKVLPGPSRIRLMIDQIFGLR